MNPNQQPQGQTTQPETDALSARPEDSLPVSAFASPQDDYSLESLDVASQDGTTVAGHSSKQAVNQHKQAAYPGMGRNLSSRRAALVSLAVTMVVILITAGTATFFLRNKPDSPTATSTVPTQDIDISAQPQLDVEIVGDAPSLLVKGDLLTRGQLKLSQDGFLASVQAANLSSNQTYTLPDQSGVICLDSGNCAYATPDQLTPSKPKSMAPPLT